MSEIYISHTGNGTAYVDNPYPNYGEYFTIYAYPNPPDTLDNISVQDAHGMYIAVDPHLEEQTLRYREEYGEYITILVEFSGTEPPTPSTVPVWLLAKIHDNNFKRR